jgi:hypothetical protein
MMLAKRVFRGWAQKLRQACASSRAARAHVPQALCSTAASAVGIYAGFLLVPGAARSLSCRPAGNKGDPRTLHLLLPLMHLP